MTTYNTGNPLGSTDPRDLSDNSENFDRFANGTDPSYSDRLGNTRKSFSGMESDFQQFLLNSGYEDLGTYAAGIEVTARNQIILDGGEYWRVAAGTAIPYTTTGAGMPEGGAFVAVGDAALRQELNGPLSSGQGANLVNGATIYVGSVAELEAQSLPGGTSVYLTDVGRAGIGVVKSGSHTPDPQKGVFIDIANGNYWERIFSGTAVNPSWFGADMTGATDNATIAEYICNNGYNVRVEDGDVFAFSEISVTGRPKFFGPGTISRVNSTSSAWMEFSDMVDVCFDGLTIDLNNSASSAGTTWLTTNNTGSENLTIRNNKIINIANTNLFDFMEGQLPNINVVIHNNVFDGGDLVYNSHISSPYNLLGFKFTDNLLINCAIAATTCSSGYDPQIHGDPGDILISGNVAKGFSPNDPNNQPNQSMILVRSTTSSGSPVMQRVIISDNIIHGGKIGIALAENPDNKFKGVLLTDNIIHNATNIGISVGRNNAGSELSTVIVSNNSIYNDIDYLDSIGAVAFNRGIGLEGPNILCCNNTIENTRNSGIHIQGSDNKVSGNYVKNCALDPNFNVGAGAEGGVYCFAGSAGAVITDNVIRGGGFPGDSLTFGIGVGDSDSIHDCLIQGNDIDCGGSLNFGIMTNRFSSAPFSYNNVFRNNVIRNQKSNYSIMVRNVTDANNLTILDNTGWGEIETTWNPGTVAAGATATLTIPSYDCTAGDLVIVDFGGVQTDSGINNKAAWVASGYVSVSTFYGTGNPGEITVQLTNLSSSSETFTEPGRLLVRLEKRNSV